MTAGVHGAFAGISPAASGATTAAGPVIYSINPSSGPATGGTTVVITGSGLTRVRWCYLRGGGEPLRFMTFAADSDWRITAVTPPGMAGKTYQLVVQADWDYDSGFTSSETAP